MIFITKFLYLKIFLYKKMLEKNTCFGCEFQSSATKFLKKEELENLEKCSVGIHFKKNDIIFKENIFSSNVIYLKKGIIKLHKKTSSKEKIIKIVKSPNYLGIPATFNEKYHYYSATSLSDTMVCFIQKEKFKDFIYSNSDFAYKIIKSLCENEIILLEQCFNKSKKNVRGRIAETLLFFYNEIFHQKKFIIPLTRDEFGKYIDTSRESVSRILTEFNKDRIINLTAKNVEILNEKLLEMISENG